MPAPANTAGDPCDLTIRQAAAALRDGALSALTLTDAVLARAAATQPTLNAYITLTPDAARADARRADDELAAGHDRGPLHGIPIGLKDLIDLAGVPNTAGSRVFRDRVSSSDAHVVTLLRQAGAVITGKCNMHEMAMGGTNANPHFGDVRNPWNLDHVPGGSSGGSAAAVAAGACLAALGTDTAGSIRGPASLCGLVGVKPTYGLVSRRGVQPTSWSLDHIGPLARTVQDAVLVLNAIAAYDPHDPASADRPHEDFTRDLGRGVAGLRIGVPRDPLWLDVQPQVASACEAALDVLRDLGCHVQDVQLPRLAAAGRPSIFLAEAAAYHATNLARRPHDFAPDVLARLRQGAATPATTYLNDQRNRRKLIAEARDAFQQVDILLSPATPTPAPRRSEGDPDYQLSRLAQYYNLTGIPAASIPAGFSRDGLPIGCMIGAGHFQEATLCRLAAAYEAATGWESHRPPPSPRPRPHPGPSPTLDPSGRPSAPEPAGPPA